MEAEGSERGGAVSSISRAIFLSVFLSLSLSVFLSLSLCLSLSLSLSSEFTFSRFRCSMGEGASQEGQ